MKKLNKFIAIALSLFTVFSLVACKDEEEENPIQTENSYIGETDIDFVKNGQSDYKILLPAQATDTENYASGELVTFFKHTQDCNLLNETDQCE